MHAQSLAKLLLLVVLAAAPLSMVIIGPAIARVDSPSKSNLKKESFDQDPDWEGHNNRVVPDEYPRVVQNFGYVRSQIAGKAAGEMGGQVTRAFEPAYYADRVGPLTLDDKLTASGTFAITKTTGGSGIFFGFFRAKQPGGSGRPIGSLGMDFDCERSGARLAVRLITATNQSCGTFITPFIPGKFRPTPIRNDGTRYDWKLDYDPQAAGGNGRFVFTLRGDAPKTGELETGDQPIAVQREIRSRFPETTTFTVDLPPGYKQHGTTFDHFGLMNMMKPGGSMSIYFDDLHYNGRSQDFTEDPHWDAAGNRADYRSKFVVGAHDFGFSQTSHARGKAGEVGGTLWRAGPYAYYADRVRPLSLNDRLEARGKVVLKVGGPDSDIFLGWFNSSNKEAPPVDSGNFLGVHVGGPTRVGHYFQPCVTNAAGSQGKSEAGPVMSHGRVHHWSIIYDPAANDGNGAITVTLDNESETLRLKKGLKAQGANFDRFGLLTPSSGGQMVTLYLDDIEYTAAAAR